MILGKLAVESTMVFKHVRERVHHLGLKPEDRRLEVDGVVLDGFQLLLGGLICQRCCMFQLQDQVTQSSEFGRHGVFEFSQRAPNSLALAQRLLDAVQVLARVGQPRLVEKHINLLQNLLALVRGLPPCSWCCVSACSLSTFSCCEFMNSVRTVRSCEFGPILMVCRAEATVCPRLVVKAG